MKPFYEAIAPDELHPSFQLLEVELFKRGTYWHYHQQIELTYVLSGSGIRMVGDHLGQFVAGDLMLTGENLPHDFNMRHDSESSLFLVIQFQPDIVRQFPELEAITRLIAKAKRGLLYQSLPVELDNLLRQFSQASSAQQVIMMMQILLQISQLNRPIELCSDSFTLISPGEVQTNRMNMVVNFVSEHFIRSIELKEVAIVAAMTEQSFCRWFKHTMGCSFVTYLNRYRVEQASRWLVESEKPVGLIASMCGFETLSSFNRAFKKNKGVPPSQFRQKWALAR